MEKDYDRKDIKSQEAENNTVDAYWEDKTKTVSYINRLHFSGDKKWISCVVAVKGTKSYQKFSIMIKAGGIITAYEEFGLRENEIRVVERGINQASSIDVTGQLISDGFFTAGGKIHVSCTYDPGEQYKSKSVRWETDTDERIGIDNLYLNDNQFWDKCEIYVEGHKNKKTGCLLTLISNGEIHKNGMADWLELQDTQSTTYDYEIKQKVTLIVAGYIADLSYLGAGVRIILTGYYK